MPIPFREREACFHGRPRRPAIPQFRPVFNEDRHTAVVFDHSRHCDSNSDISAQRSRSIQRILWDHTLLLSLKVSFLIDWLGILPWVSLGLASLQESTSTIFMPGRSSQSHLRAVQLLSLCGGASVLGALYKPLILRDVGAIMNLYCFARLGTDHPTTSRNTSASPLGLSRRSLYITINTARAEELRTLPLPNLIQLQKPPRSKMESKLTVDR